MEYINVHFIFNTDNYYSYIFDYSSTFAARQGRHGRHIRRRTWFANGRNVRNAKDCQPLGKNHEIPCNCYSFADFAC